MLGFLRGFAYGVVLIAAGWLVGSIYPAPHQLTDPIKKRTEVLVERMDLSPETMARLRAALSPEQFNRLKTQAANFAASTGAAIEVEHSDAGDIERQDAFEMAEGAAPAAPVAGGGAFETSLSLCPSMTVSNAPAAGADRKVSHYAPRVNVNGVMLAVAPTRGACLASGFGDRNGRQHKGIDLHSGTGGPILAAADGTVIEEKYRDDYGNMLLIDHGHGVYTRYAHLSSFASGLHVGDHVTAGQQIGLMGNTAGYSIPVHLHYELLLGDYNNPKASFGLTPHSPFEYQSAG